MGRPRKIENMFKRPKENVQFSEGQKSKGILDDFAVRKVVDAKEIIYNGTEIGLEFSTTTLKADHITEKTTGHRIVIENQINLNRVGANIIRASNAGGDLRLGAGGGSNDFKIDTDGNVDIFENLTVGGNLTTTGAGKFGEVVINSTQNYKITEDLTESSNLMIQGQTPNANTFLVITDHDGDGTEFVGLNITPRRGANLESLNFYFNPGTDEWWMKQESLGNDYPLVFDIGGANQLVLSKDIMGVGIGKMPSTTLDVAGTGRFDGNLGIKTPGIPVYELEINGEVSITGANGAAGSDAPDVMIITGGKGGGGIAPEDDGKKGSDVVITSGIGGNTAEGNAGDSGDIELTIAAPGSPGGGSYGDVYLAKNGGDVIGAKIRLTSIGGYAIKLTNETGAVSVAGETVIASVGTADAVDASGMSELQCIGVFLDDSVAEHAEAWVVVSGIADVKADGVGWALGDRIVASGTARRGVANNNPAVAVHFQEIGHAVEAAGANASGRVVLHFL